MSSFYELVYQTVARVPEGQVVTYGQIAHYLGNPSGSRAVGWAMRQCSPELPWHRVINAQGRPSTRERTGYPHLQRSLLEAEGIVFKPDGSLSLQEYRWDGI